MTHEPPEPKSSPPQHVQRMAGGGLACLHCGGEVGEDGLSVGYDEGMDEPGEMDDDETPQDEEAQMHYARALKSKGDY